MSKGKVMIGILSGMAAGAALGVLFAPDKGKVTRKKISRKTEDYTESVKEKFNEFMDEINDKFDEVKHEVSGVAEKGKARFQGVKKSLNAVKG